jgi:tetratricopeptide (TPR) repeat protein
MDEQKLRPIKEKRTNNGGSFFQIRLSFAIFLVASTAFITIIINNYLQQQQLKNVKSEINQLNRRQEQLEMGKIGDFSVRALAERVDYVTNQQEVIVSSTQQMIDYMTSTFTIISVFFLLASGYFLYRQQKSEKREDEGWVLAKDLLELVTESQEFVVEVQRELQRQQDVQKKHQDQIRAQVEQTAKFLDLRSNVLISQFARDTIDKGIQFNKLVDISNRIDMIRFQLTTFNLSLNPNCYFLKAVYEYIIGNYNAAKEEFDNLIAERENAILDDMQKKQLSLCYYYKGLIEYNIQGNLELAERFMSLAMEHDPHDHNPDYKSQILKAEIKLKQGSPDTFNCFEEIRTRLLRTPIRTQTQERLLSHATLGMVYAKILAGGLKFLPKYYERIRKLERSTIVQAINWLQESFNEHIYSYLTMGQLAIILADRTAELEIQSPEFYFTKTYEILERSKPYEVKEETRGKLLAYSVKLVCE